jgi:hypothetical protein
MLIRPEKQAHRELLFDRATAAKDAARAVRLEARETLARCTESRLALDAARRGREDRASS